MRKAMIKGKEIKISERAFSRLQSRFNVKNFKPGEAASWDDDMQVNYSRCYLCDLHKNTCDTCPFGVFEKHQIGCFEALKSILTPYQKSVFDDKVFLFDDSIKYYTSNKKAVERVIKKIYSCINEGFKKVKERK